MRLDTLTGAVAAGLALVLALGLLVLALAVRTHQAHRQPGAGIYRETAVQRRLSTGFHERAVVDPELTQPLPVLDEQEVTPR